MSATFMAVGSGGWVNAAHVVLISDTGVAVVNNPDGGSLHLKLEVDWENAENILEITEHPTHDRTTYHAAR